MHLVDDIVRNFPHMSDFYPYFMFPGGASQVGFNLFPRLLASISWIAGLGSPSQQTIDIIGVFMPAVMGALVVIPVYFIGRELFGRTAGILSAGLVMIIPGEFMGRSILGFTDYHIAETLFSTVTILFLILAIKTANQRQLTFNHLIHFDWKRLRKPLIYSWLAAVFILIYILTWTGALLFIFIIFTYFVVQFIIGHLKNKSIEYLGIVSFSFFFVTLIISLLVITSRLYQAALIIGLIVPTVLSTISLLMTRRQIKPVYYPLAIAGLGLAGLGLLYLVSPSLFDSIFSTFRIFAPTGAQLTTIEMQPLISQQYGNPLAIAWGNYTTGFFLSFISLGILIYLMVREGNAEKSMLVIWSLIILAATLGQRRFGYYFAVNVALLTGYLSWRIMQLAGFRELASRAVETAKNMTTRKIRITQGRSPIIARVNMTLAMIVIFFVVFFWNIQPAIAVTSGTPYAPSNAWINSLTWLKENTPEPFNDPDTYYQLEQDGKYSALSDLMIAFPNPTEDPDYYAKLERSYPYPESAYGVLSWWDYGYWITRIAHRIPNANPNQDPRAITMVASFFTSQDEESANGIIETLGSEYLIIDYESAYISPQTSGGKFSAIIIWAGKHPAQFFETFVVPQENRLIPVVLYYPAYFQSMAVRLYNFDGKAVTPDVVIVVSSDIRTDENGRPFKLLTSAQEFTIYQDAVDFIDAQETPSDYRIVSANPMSSPVLIGALENYELVYGSEDQINLPYFGGSPVVKIFQYQE